MVLVEAGATSGARHQVEECISRGKPVFIHASLLWKELEWLQRGLCASRAHTHRNRPKGDPE
jgi:hypothetical protein